MTRSTGAGWKYLYYGVINEDGYLIGSTASGASAGDQDGEAMLRVRGARTIPLTIPEQEVVVVSGDDEPLVSFDFEPEALTSGQFETAGLDTAFEAVLTGVNEVTTLGAGTMIAANPGDPARPTMFLLAMRRAKSLASGASFGASQWEARLILRADVKSLDTDFTQREFTPYRYNFNVSKGSAYPSGLTFTESRDGYLITDIVKVVNLSTPIMFQAWRGNNSQQDFNLAYTPANGSDNLVVTIDGQIQDLTTHYTYSNGVISIVGTPGTDARIVAYYDVAEGSLT